MDNAPNRTVPGGGGRTRQLGLYAAVILAVFLIGFVPMWLNARARASERDEAQQALRRTEIENTLAAAAILARRGDYEPAREAASAFYTTVQAELARTPSMFAEGQREALQSLLAPRDQMITLLARADPAAADRLADAYVAYRQAMGTLE